MKNILLLIFYILTAISFYKLIGTIIQVKENKILKGIAFVSMIIISPIVIYSHDLVNVTCTMLGFFTVMLLCYKGAIMERVGIVMVLYPIVVSVNFILNDLFVLVYFFFGNTTSVYNIFQIAKAIIICLIWFLIYIIFRPKFTYIQGTLNTKTWILIAVICATPLIAIYCSIIFTPIDEVMKIYPIALSCIVTSLGVLYLICEFAKKEKLTEENHALNLKYSHYQELAANQESLRSLKHDMNNHLSIISSFIKNHDWNQANDYFNELSDKFVAESRQFCKNPVVNAVLNSKYNFAIHNNIDCFFNIDLGIILPINDIELCSLFGNTLDNAIEASCAIDEIELRKISLKARVDKGYFSFSISNYYNGQKRFANGNYQTLKTDSIHHGIGLKTVRSIVRRYDGVIDISHANDIFEVIIAIKVT